MDPKEPNLEPTLEPNLEPNLEAMEKFERLKALDLKEITGDFGLLSQD